MLGILPAPVLLSEANNTGSQSQRAVSLGMVNSLGQYTSIVPQFIFPTKEAQRLWSEPGLYAPHYHPELSDVSVLPYEKPESVVVDVINQHDLARGFRYAV